MRSRVIGGRLEGRRVWSRRGRRRGREAVSCCRLLGARAEGWGRRSSPRGRGGVGFAARKLSKCTCVYAHLHTFTHSYTLRQTPCPPPHPTHTHRVCPQGFAVIQSPYTLNRRKGARAVEGSQQQTARRERFPSRFPRRPPVGRPASALSGVAAGAVPGRSVSARSSPQLSWSEK